MVTESFLIWREDADCAQRALDSSSWLRFDALMPVEVVVLEDGVTLVTVLVIVSILALIDQMIVQGRNLDDLLTLPASCEHRALLPIVDINGLFVEVLVVLTAEVADFFIDFLTVTIICLIVTFIRRLSLRILLKIGFHLLVDWILLLSGRSLILFDTASFISCTSISCSTSGSPRVDICLNNFLSCL